MIIRNDTMDGRVVRNLPFAKSAAVLHENHLQLAGFERYSELELKWQRRPWHLGLWIAEGRLRVTHEQGEMAVDSGELLIAPAGRPRSATSSAMLSYFYVHFPDHPNWRMLSGTHPYKRESLYLERMSGLLPLLEEDGPDASAATDRAAVHLARAFCEYVVADALQETDIRLLELRNRFAGLWQRVYEEPGQPWSIELMAREAGYSSGHFHRACREVYGTSPMKMVTRMRLEKGAFLLLHSTDSIEVVAATVGFSSARAFSEAFLRAYGVRPGRYRRERIGGH